MKKKSIGLWIENNVERTMHMRDTVEILGVKIDKIDFDVAIIGCGAYGIFLADYIKSLGKKAIHLGVIAFQIMIVGVVRL